MTTHAMTIDFHGIAQIGFSIAAIIAAWRGRKALRERKVKKDD